MYLTQALREQSAQSKGLGKVETGGSLDRNCTPDLKSMSSHLKHQGMKAIEVRHSMSAFGIHVFLQRQEHPHIQDKEKIR